MTLAFQAILLIAPALFTLFYSFFALKKGFESEDYISKRWAVAHRCGYVAYFFWSIYLFITWLILGRIEILDFAPAGLLSEISYRIFAVSIGAFSILPLIVSVSLHVLAFGWIDRRTRKEAFSLLSYLRLHLALWLWSSNRLMLIITLIMSQTFFFTFDGKGFGINLVNSTLILFASFFVFSYSFPFSFRLFGLSVPLNDHQLKSKADTFAKELGVTVKRLFRMRTFGVPMVNAFATSNSDIYLADGILDSFESEEREAILAHEVGHLPHIKKYSQIRLAFSFAFSFLALGVLPLGFEKIPGITCFFFMIFGWSFMSWLASKEKKFQKKCETQADAVAATLAGSEAYAKALAHLHSINLIPAKFSEREGKYLSHPSLEERVNSVSKGDDTVVITHNVPLPSGSESHEGTSEA